MELSEEFTKELENTTSTVVVDPSKSESLGQRKNNLSKKNQIALINLKDKLIEQKISDAISKELVFISKAEEYYREMREESLGKIDHDGNYRFEVVFAELLHPFTKKM